MQLAELVAVSDRLQATPARHKQVQILAEWLRRLSGEEIAVGIHFVSGQTRQGRIGVGPATLREALAAGAADGASLALREVDLALAEITQAAGPGAGRLRRERLAALFGSATRAEQAFLARLLNGELRQGALEATVIEAAAQATAVEAADIRRAAMVEGNTAIVVRAALTEGRRGLERFALRLLRPVRPMLAQTATDVAEALARLGAAAFEFKLDGGRVQVHKSGDDVRVYTRRLRDITPSVPEVAEAVRALAPSGLILDGEAIALGPEGRPLPFQQTMRRFGRKQEVEALRRRLPLSVFFFDCLKAGGRDLIGEPMRVRFEALAEIVPARLRAPRLVTASQSAATAFLEEALRQGHEGLVAKSLVAPYVAGTREAAWLKIKAARTLDLVVLAAEWGHGRRRGWLSNLHLGARDPDTGGYVMLGKTFKGMTDAMLQWQTDELLALEVRRDAYTVHVRPVLVVEVAFDGLQTSPRYPGGLALRFARVKGYRHDKRPEEADTIETVRALYAGQDTAPDRR